MDLCDTKHHRICWRGFVYANYAISVNGSGGSSLFPQIVIAIMILFCILSAISTARQKASENNEFKILNMPDIVFTIIVSIIYTYLWKIFGFSYIISFIFVAVLVFRYNKKDPLKRKIMNAAIASAIVNVSVFIVFDLLFNLTF